jgi:hypothetical protein
MIYLSITQIDADTGIICTAEPMRTGPSFPNLKNWNLSWWNESTWPIATTFEGAHTLAPLFFGTCDDDADTTIAGVLQVLTEAEFNAAKVAEHEARKPYPSWIGYIDTMTWAAPVARPADAIMNGGNVRYQWDEATLNWIPQA